MTDKVTPLHGARDGRGGSTRDTPKMEDVLSSKRRSLERISARAEEARALREKECELEVELIAAEVERDAAVRKSGLDLAPDRAADIAAALDHQHQTRARLDTLVQQAARSRRETSNQLERLQAARSALQAWLDAPRVLKGARLNPVAHGVLVVAIGATVWAALAIHLVFLVLLFPLCLPLALLALSRQDLWWLRMGAERRYKETELEPPAAWNAGTVRTRLSEIESSLHAVSLRGEELSALEEMQDSEQALAATELEQAQKQLDAVLGEAGLEPESIDGELERWLELVGRGLRINKELEEIRAKRAAISTQANQGREELFRFLSRHGHAPREGHADLDALAAGLDDLAGQHRDAD